MPGLNVGLTEGLVGSLGSISGLLIVGGRFVDGNLTQFGGIPVVPGGHR
jgi:hypothetical protein